MDRVTYDQAVFEAIEMYLIYSSTISPAPYMEKQE